MADIVASAFYQAANRASPNWDMRPAEKLRPILPAPGGVAANVGVTVWPLPGQATVPDDSREIFRRYGYEF